ncbi:hypothetical protein KW798_00325 [Candidatus Parcubacteria bacterium]|nr:hypothetical protein [Candidatus Parcubacteria bacterium]
MSPEHLSTLITSYGYWILIPLTFLEGPIIAFVAGTLASVGYFNIWLLATLFFVRDVGLDAVYYALGYWGRDKKFTHKMMAKLGVTGDHLDEVREIWEKHAGKTMFMGKLSYGIASAFIVVAGVIKMPLRKFFTWAVIVAVVQYGGLLVLGYFFGNAFGSKLSGLLENLQYAILGLSVFIFLYYGFSWYMRGSFFKTERREEQMHEMK